MILGRMAKTAGFGSNSPAHLVAVAAAAVERLLPLWDHSQYRRSKAVDVALRLLRKFAVGQSVAPEDLAAASARVARDWEARPNEEDNIDASSHIFAAIQAGLACASPPLAKRAAKDLRDCLDFAVVEAAENFGDELGRTAAGERAWLRKAMNAAKSAGGKPLAPETLLAASTIKRPGKKRR
jgi:hypothetical protein